jgi:hypothetical protein
MKVLIGMCGLISACKFGCLTSILGPSVQMAGNLMCYQWFYAANIKIKNIVTNLQKKKVTHDHFIRHINSK